MVDRSRQCVNSYDAGKYRKTSLEIQWWLSRCDDDVVVVVVVNKVGKTSRLL